MRILVVEDDEVLREGLSVGLSLKGMTVDCVSGAEDALSALAADRFDAVVLDLMLPDGSGLDVLAFIRRRSDPTPVVVLTARDGVSDRIAGLDGGADDYVGKPFDLDELAARIRAVVRRANGRSKGDLTWNGLVIDPSRMEGRFRGRAVRFSRREFSVISALMEQPGRIVPKAALEERLYGWQEEIESNAIEVHVHHLRAKLGSDFIETVRGVGYRVALP